MAEKQNWLKWVAIGCGAVILLGVTIGVGVYFVVRGATAGPEAVAKQFLAAAGAGDADRAYGFFAAPLKEEQPLESFREAVASNPTLFAVVDTSFSERSIDNAGAKLSGTATLKAGTKVPISFSLAKENDSWKLLAYHIGAQD